MEAVEIKQNIYWVGGIDWDIRNFHGYLTQRGSTYNAYLIIDKKITLIDTVKHYCYEEMLERIKSVIDPAKIDIIISNHVEMDHSGSLPKLLDVCPEAKIYCSAKGAEGLKAHYQAAWDFEIVKTGDSLNIGERNLAFVNTPMVHWPDNMITYCSEEKILFSNDGFGQHIASEERFTDEIDQEIIFNEAKKYYANIVLPFGTMVQKELAAAKDLDIAMICPSHGLIWRKQNQIAQIITSYQGWATNQTTEKALIIYDTMWHSTEKIAAAIKNSFIEKKIEAKIFDLKERHISDIMTDVIDAKYICVGSPTLNNNIMPTIAAFLTYMKGLKPQGRVGLAFGSYGWSGESVDQIERVFKELEYKILPQIKVKYIPRAAELQGVVSSL